METDQEVLMWLYYRLKRLDVGVSEFTDYMWRFRSIITDGVKKGQESRKSYDEEKMHKKTKIKA